MKSEMTRRSMFAALLALVVAPLIKTLPAPMLLIPPINRFKFRQIGLSSSSQKLLALQLAKMGYLDWWQLAEALDIQNSGAPSIHSFDPLV